MYLAKMFQLEQLIEEPSRIAKNTWSQIDLVFSNRPEIIVKSGVEHIGISDHSLIYIHRKKLYHVSNQRLYIHHSINTNTKVFLTRPANKNA